jgi:hypothetical protein
LRLQFFFSQLSRRLNAAIIITAGIIPIPAIKFIEATSTAMDRQSWEDIVADITAADITTTHIIRIEPKK